MFGWSDKIWAYSTSYKKKLTFYARCTGRGTGVLHATYGRASGIDTGAASAILSDRS